MRELIYNSRQMKIYSDGSLEWHSDNILGVYEGTWQWNKVQRYFEFKYRNDRDWEPMCKRHSEAIEHYIRKVIES